MSYRIDGFDPFVRFSIGAFNGWTRNSAITSAILLKRLGTGAWGGLHVMDAGTTTNFSYPIELNPSNHLATDFTAANPFASTASFTDTTNWQIIAVAWDGTTTAAHVDYRWKVGSGAWSSETATSPGSNATAAGSGYRHIVGNEAGSGDDGNYDVVCVGSIRSKLSQASIESLDMTNFSSWQNVFTGSSAWLIGFQAIGTLTDRTGNGGNESSRSAGVTLQADPSGWSWGGAASAVVTNTVKRNNAALLYYL